MDYRKIAEAVNAYDEMQPDMPLDDFVQEYLRDADDAERDFLDAYYDPYEYQGDLIEMRYRER